MHSRGPPKNFDFQDFDFQRPSRGLRENFQRTVDFQILRSDGQGGARHVDAAPDHPTEGVDERHISEGDQLGKDRADKARHGLQGGARQDEGGWKEGWREGAVGDGYEGGGAGEGGACPCGSYS